MTKKEIQQLLDQFEPELRANIEVAQAELKEARSLTNKLDNLFKKATELSSKLEDPTAGIEAKLTSSDETIKKIEVVAVSANEFLDTIKEKLQNIQQNIETMESAYAEFVVIKTKIDDPAAGLNAFLASAKASSEEALSAAKSTDTLRVDVEASFTKIQSYITKMENAYSEFVASKTKIDDPATGLEAILENAQSIHDDISAVGKTSQTLYVEIGNFKNEAAKNIASIQAIKKESNTALDHIKQTETDSIETKERIAEIFELVSQSGHANYFDKRRKKLIQASWAWLFIAVSSLCSAVWLACDLLLPYVGEAIKEGGNVNSGELAVLILRAFTITPLIAFSVLSFNQYGKERRLAEQYAFKAVSASTIEGSIALIERSLKSVPSAHLNTQLADFAIRTAHSLHAEPIELQRNSKFSVSAGNKLIKVGAEMNETLEDIGKYIKNAVGTTKKD